MSHLAVFEFAVVPGRVQHAIAGVQTTLLFPGGDLERGHVVVVDIVTDDQDFVVLAPRAL
jgi:hypothetical protein